MDYCDNEHFGQQWWWERILSHVLFCQPSILYCWSSRDAQVGLFHLESKRERGMSRDPGMGWWRMVDGNSIGGFVVVWCSQLVILVLCVFSYENWDASHREVAGGGGTSVGSWDVVFLFPQFKCFFHPHRTWHCFFTIIFYSLLVPNFED